MQAMILNGIGQPLTPVELDGPTERPGGERITITACGVCHSDLHVVDGDYPVSFPRILGHEIVGIHDRLGPVIVYAPWGCRQSDCPQCASGQEMICPNSSEVGLVVDGGYCEEIVVASEDYLVPLGNLDPIQAAPLACGGLTAYRATKKALAHLGHDGARVAVIGAGGLGQYSIQYLPLLSKAEITAVDTSAEKRATAQELGAHRAFTLDELEGPYDAIIDFVGADATLAAASSTVARQGLVVVVGLFGGRVPFGLGAQANEASLTTSIWGTLEELHELIELANAHDLKSPIETLALSQAQEAHDRLRRGTVAGRVVLVPDALVSSSFSRLLD